MIRPSPDDLELLFMCMVMKYGTPVVAWQACTADQSSWMVATFGAAWKQRFNIEDVSELCARFSDWMKLNARPES